MAVRSFGRGRPNSRNAIQWTATVTANIAAAAHPNASDFGAEDKQPQQTGDRHKGNTSGLRKWAGRSKQRRLKDASECFTQAAGAVDQLTGMRMQQGISRNDR